MSTICVTYDGTQHCTVRQDDKGRSLAVEGCPSWGARGEELSPFEMVGSGLASCMLFAMGIAAERHDLDISGTRVEVRIATTQEPVHRIGEIQLSFDIPKDFAVSDRALLEKATSACPIKPSFHPDIRIQTDFTYSHRHEQREEVSETN